MKSCLMVTVCVVLRRPGLLRGQPQSVGRSSQTAASGQTGREEPRLLPEDLQRTQEGQTQRRQVALVKVHAAHTTAQCWLTFHVTPSESGSVSRRASTCH